MLRDVSLCCSCWAMASLLLLTFVSVALAAAPGSLGGLQYQGLAVTSPTSWFNVWFSTPEGIGGFDNSGSNGLRHPRLRHAPTPRPRPPFGYTRYNGPDTWALDSPACGGVRQSPIDLRPDSMLRLRTRAPLRWTRYWRAPRNLTMHNSGHTVQVMGSWDGEGAPVLSGGPLDGDYEFLQLHFHWGPDDHLGSEHTVHNVSFPMEMHAVHFKREYGTQQSAERFSDGLVVVSYLFRVRRAPNSALEPVLSALNAVRGAELSAPLSPFPLARLMKEFEEDYVMYDGSLTTPPCSEAVTWLVSAQPLPVSREQLEEFRTLEGLDGEVDRNFRPVQPSNGRPVYYVDVE